MPQISTILQDELQNSGDRIRLYTEGIFNKAYERSVWVACRVLHPIMVKKRTVRKVGQEVVSIGFPKTSLDKWAMRRRVERVDDDCVLIYMNESEAMPFAVDEYEAWRAGIELAAKETASVNADTDIDEACEAYVKQRKQDDLNEIIASEKLKADETAKFVENAFRDGAIRTDIDKILPAMSRFGGGNRQEKKKTVIEKLKVFFEKYFGVV